MKILPGEYGFYSNVNPAVDHPRWSQARERRLPDFFASTETLPFNGYADQVASLYAGHGPEEVLLTMAFARACSGLRAAGPPVHCATGFAATPFASPSLSFFSCACCRRCLLVHGVDPFEPDLLGANPAETIEHVTGDWRAPVPPDTLAITPLRRITGWNWLIKFRRMLGLFAFFYGVVHLSAYVAFDHYFDVRGDRSRTSSSGPSSRWASPRWC